MAYQNYVGAWLQESQQGGAQVNGSSPWQTVYGPNANAVWGVTGDHDTLMGGAGDDFYWLPNPGLSVVEQPNGGIDTVEIWQSYSLPANVENLIVFGNSQYAIGNSGDNIIKATGAGDTIYGGAGEDVFVGSGGGGTTFIVGQGEGDKVIQNFTEGTDTLRLIGGNLNSFSAVIGAMSQHGSDVDLNDGGSHILFRNASIGQFQARDFQLPINPSQVGGMAFAEDFNSPSTIGANWSTSFGPAGQLTSFTLPYNGEKEIYTDANFTGTSSSSLGLNPFSVNNGVLTISANPVSASQSQQMWGYQYSSGMLLSNFTQTYGYFEMKAELPKGQGLWPAFWLIGPNQSEIDVLEALGTDTRTADTAVHSPSISPGYSTPNLNPYPDGMHTYGVLWDPQHITYYIDGTQVWQVNTPGDMNQPMRMVVNLAVGGNWPGSPDSSTPWPAQLKIDYIHAYGLPGSGGSATYSPPSSGGSTTTTPSGSGGSTPSTTGSTGTGQTFTATAVGATLTGTSGNDTFYASQANDTLTGGAGADTFVFNKQPWAPDHITDFQVGTDRIDLSTMFNAYGYSGSDPIADGWVKLIADGNGGTMVRLFDHQSGSSQWGNSIIDLDHVSPAGLSWASLSGGGGSSDSAGTTSSTGSGQTFTASSVGATLNGTSGNDTFYASQGNDTLTGGAGADTFVFNHQPWAPDHITDFQVGADRLDLSAMLKAYGYAGSDPIADGWVRLIDDGAGGAMVRLFDHQSGSSQWGNSIIDLDHISPTGLSWSSLSAGGGSSGSTGAVPGQSLAATGPGQTVLGTAGNDTITAGPGNDLLVGGAGADTFKFTSEPWSPNTITDFQTGVDKLDFSALLKTYGYTGNDPIHDGWLSVYSDGNGGSIIRFLDHTAGAPQWGNTIIDLLHVAPNQVSPSDWILH